MSTCLSFMKVCSTERTNEIWLQIQWGGKHIWTENGKSLNNCLHMWQTGNHSSQLHHMTTHKRKQCEKVQVWLNQVSQHCFRLSLHPCISNVGHHLLQSRTTIFTRSLLVLLAVFTQCSHLDISYMADSGHKTIYHSVYLHRVQMLYMRLHITPLVFPSHVWIILHINSFITRKYWCCNTN